MIDQFLCKSHKTAIFIDGAHLYTGSRYLGFDVDYKRLRGIISQHSQLIRSNYYLVITNGDEYSKLKPVADWLSYNHFVSTAAEKCARWRRNSVPVGLIKKGLEALLIDPRCEPRGA